MLIGPMIGNLRKGTICKQKGCVSRKNRKAQNKFGDVVQGTTLIYQGSHELSVYNVHLVNQDTMCIQ